MTFMAIDSKRLLAEVRENLSKLNDCADHAFTRNPEPYPGVMGARYTCTRCTGVVDAHAYHWYTRGRAHEHVSPSKSPLGQPA